MLSKYFACFALIPALLLASCATAAPTEPAPIGSSPDSTGTPPAPAATPLGLTAALSELQGSVEIKRSGLADFSPASQEMSLQVLDQIQTGTDGRVRLDLSSGTFIRVAPNSLFTLQTNDEKDGSLITRLELQAGRLWVILQGGQLEVETPSGIASVRGSYMSVWVDPLTSDVWVTCLEGWCQAENPSAALDMLAGEGAILYAWDPAGTLPPPPPQLRYISQQEIDDFLANNPEAQQVMPAIIATASALPPLPPASNPGNCLNLLTPSDGIYYPGPARVDFSWSEYPGAYQYEVIFTSPLGSTFSFIASDTHLTRYIESFLQGGSYQWSVTARNSNLEDICSSQPSTFSKAVTQLPEPSDIPGLGEDQEGPSTPFYNQSGPVGLQQGPCFALDFSVSTTLNGTIQVIYGPSPDDLEGSAPPYFDIGSGPGTGSATLDFTAVGGSLFYYVFAVNDGSGTILDTIIYDFQCPVF